MGGSGGGYHKPPGGGTSTNCETLSFTATLLSTDAQVLLKLNVGDVLQIRRGEYSVFVEREAGERVGSIVTNITQLLSCMNDDHSYIARVLEVKDGACQVQVTHL